MVCCAVHWVGGSGVPCTSNKKVTSFCCVCSKKEDNLILCMYLSTLLHRDYFVVGMALVFLLLPFLPASGILFRVGFVIAER